MTTVSRSNSIKHLMRRASFGASNDALQRMSDKTFEEIVDDLLEPESQPDYDELTFFRYHPMADVMHVDKHAKINWMYRMTHSQRYLQEKMALFWHYVFATGDLKVNNPYPMYKQIEMFRKHGIGNYRTLLIELAKDPAMIFWLDNQENHKRAPNENWGRELLELFSLGVGHYTEKDVFECARAFTGWTITNRISGIQLGNIPWIFQYKPEDHDNGEKTFLGHTGNFNGEDIIDIILKQPACAAFITRHLYNFFVADEPEVPKWPNEPPRDPKAIEYLSKVFVESNYEIKPVLRALFNSDFFKEAIYQKVKSPIEVVVGTLKLTGDMNGPDPRWGEIFLTPINMGQDILNPPTVEGWHTGKEWINSGAFINRVNFVADRLKNTELPGVKTIVENVKQNSNLNQAESIVDSCLEELSCSKLETQTYNELIEDINSDEGSNGNGSIDRQITNTLAMIAGTKEYQFC